MSTFSGIIDNGLTSAEAFYKTISQLIPEGIPTITTPTSLQVVQRGAGANMSVDISIGSAQISNSTGTFSYAAWQDAVSNLTIGASNPSNPRIDAIVAYVNLAAVSTTNNNNPGSLVFQDIQGTPAGSPTAPSDATITSTLGATVPWVRLANVTVPTSATQIVTANIADVRPPYAVRANLWGGSSNTFGHTVPNIADDTVVLANATQTLTAKTFTSPTVNTPAISGYTGWQTPVNGVTFTYSANNGNKEFVLTPSVDPTSWLNAGMKMKFTRGTTPPTQAMSFTAASSQYATKASPSGITFTGAFTCEAWVNLQSYTGNIQAVIGRTDNATGGAMLFINASGQVVVQYENATTYTPLTSYQSVPLNRWVHIAGVVTSVASKTGAIYINGVSVPLSVGGTGATTLVQTGNLSIGALGAGSANTFFNGYIAEARIWSVAQTQAAIQANMAINLVGTETNLVALYQGPTFNDLTSNANNLTATNGATQVTAYPYNPIEYGFVTKVASGAVTLFTGTDCTIPNMTLSSPYYSTSRAPYGFPAQRGRWKVDATYRVQQSTSLSTATGQLTGAQLNLPTGAWSRLGHKGYYQTTASSTSSLTADIGLSTATGSFSADLEATRTSIPALTAASTDNDATLNLDADYEVTSQTPIYLVAQTFAAQTVFYGKTSAAGTPTILFAECAYA